MKFTDYIQQAEDKVGGTKKLAEALGMLIQNLCYVNLAVWMFILFNIAKQVKTSQKSKDNCPSELAS